MGRHRLSKFEPLKYGDFLFPGKRTHSAKKHHVPTVEELGDVLESDDHSVPLGELLSRLDTDSVTGLREDQVASIRERYGDNAICVPDAFKRRVRGTYYLPAMTVAFCFAAAALMPHAPRDVVLDHVYAGLLMCVVAVVSYGISYWQEKRSEAVASSLGDSYPQCSVVIRSGRRLMVDRRELVVGDLVRFQAGDAVPADTRVTRAWNVEVEEGTLFAHRASSGPTPKSDRCTSDDPTASQNVAFAGTSCVKGVCQGIVIATGNRTAYGRMAERALLYQRPGTDTHAAVSGLGWFGGGVVALSLVLAAACTTLPPWTALVVLVLCQTVASMPDILYSATTVCLYSAAEAMASEGCLPKNYEAVERLGTVTVICCGKTGTITQGNMTVVGLFVDGKMTELARTGETRLQTAAHRETWKAFVRTACLCSKTTIERRRERGVIKRYYPGDQLEIAIVEMLIGTSGTQAIDATRGRHRKVFEVPFDSYRKYQVTVHEFPPEEEGAASFLVCVKGAVDVILDFCSTTCIAGESAPISRLGDLRFREEFERIMGDGGYVVGFCDLELPQEAYPLSYAFQEGNVPLFGMRFLGFVSVLDPPRPEAGEAVRTCREAGIRVILMTGDHRLTAKSVARQVGILSSGSETKHEVARRFNISPDQVPPQGTECAVLTGSEVESMDEDHLRDQLRRYPELAFARLDPRHKYRVVSCLREEGEVVAFASATSEDAPCLRDADIGIGLAKTGSDISRDAADVVLLGDGFRSIVAGIQKGHVVHRSLQSAIVYVLTSNVPELSPLFALCLLGMPQTTGPTFVLLLTLLAETIPVLVMVRRRAGDGTRRDGPSTFFRCKLVSKAYLQVGAVALASGAFAYLAVMAHEGFMPAHLLGIGRAWNSRAVNDLADSFNQEWTYASRKSLEYTCHTGFFVALLVFQWFNVPLLRREFVASCLLVPACQAAVLLFLLYTPGLSTALHLYPIKVDEWMACLPLPFFYLVCERLRTFFIRHSQRGSWLERETV